MNFVSSTLSLSSAKKLLSASTVTGLSLLLALALPAQLSAQDRQEKLPLPLNEVRMFTQALDRIRMSYVEEVDDQTLLENAIRGMLAGLDPHSSYLAGDDLDLLEESTTGEFGGLGVEVVRENGYIRAISSIDDSPADRAGIKAGDLIIRIDSKPLREIMPEEVAQMMRGVPGTDVTVTVTREGQEPFDVTITREIISIASVRSRIIAPGYAYLRISQFRVNTGNEIGKEIEKLYTENAAIDQPIKGIVLDLRNNPGGILQASVGVVDAFISEGRIVYTEGRLGQTRLDYSATRKTVAGDVPLVILINNGSASASEIVAGALQDHGRAIIMGTRSFGKGSVQTVLPIDEKRAIKLTTSLYFTPSGRSIQAQGIEPDILVEEAFVTRRSINVMQYNEADLDGHLENSDEPRTENERLAEALISAEEVLVNDYPLNEALNVLKGINAFKPARAINTTGSFAQSELN